ncbi:MAG: hypothetical protein ACRYFR_09025 [Janthinobacterium lividum]
MCRARSTQPPFVLLYAIILVAVVAGAAVGPVLPEFVRGLRKP